MSDYCREKVLRVPFDKYKHNFHPIESNEEDKELFKDDFWMWMENHYSEIFDYGKVGKFQYAPTEGWFLDFVLEDDYGEDCGDWGRVRTLLPEEEVVWKPIFSNLIPDIDMKDVHLVEFCWYNCSEAPDYYSMNPEEDEFYRFIGGPEKYIKN